MYYMHSINSIMGHPLGGAPIAMYSMYYVLVSDVSDIRISSADTNHVSCHTVKQIDALECKKPPPAGIYWQGAVAPVMEC